MTDGIGTHSDYSRLVSGQIVSRWQTTLVIMDTYNQCYMDTGHWSQESGTPGFLKCPTQ